MHVVIEPLVVYVLSTILVPYPMCTVLQRTSQGGQANTCHINNAQAPTLVSCAPKLGGMGCSGAGHFCCTFVSLGTLFNIRFNFDMSTIVSYIVMARSDWISISHPKPHSIFWFFPPSKIQKIQIQIQIQKIIFQMTNTKTKKKDYFSFFPR